MGTQEHTEYITLRQTWLFRDN